MQKLLCNETRMLWEEHDKASIVLLLINTLQCQQKKLEHKGGERYVHDLCIVCRLNSKKVLDGLPREVSCPIITANQTQENHKLNTISE